MQDLDNIQTQLAQEEAALASGQEQIEAASRQIEEARRQIAAIQAQIEATEQKIADIQNHAETIQKRVALLREYMEMAKTSRPTPPPISQMAPAPQPVHHTPVPQPAPAPQPAQPAPVELEPEPDDSLGEILPPLEEPEADLEYGEPLTAPTDGGAPATTERGPITFETLTEEVLTHELLPRTATFEEELLLLMAFHKKAIKPKEVANKFRRLDYASKQSATESSIKAQVEADQHTFEFVAGGRIALTTEGREEAQRLLDRLA
jgi:hypothetical protein